MSDLDTRPFKLVGGRLCLDFANTVDHHPPKTNGERLTTYATLVAWATQAGAIRGGAAERLLRSAAASPRQAQEVLSHAIELREGIFRLFQTSIEQRPRRSEDLATLNGLLSTASSHLRLLPGADGLLIGWPDDDLPLERVLWPVARSAAELLASPSDLRRLRHCAAEDCAWLFLDQSRNRSRRWCDMADCGNRAKARRYYAEHRALRGCRS